MGNQVAGVVLAAGFSRRLRRPKQLVELLGETLLERTVRTVHEAGLGRVVAVVNAEVLAAAQQILRAQEWSGCRVVVNEEAAEGMAASIRCGLEAVQDQDLDGILLLTCDQVGVTAEHLRALCQDRGEVTGSRYDGKVGVPAYFPASNFAALRMLRGDQGARALLQDVREVANEDLTLDVDTEDDLKRAEAWLRERST